MDVDQANGHVYVLPALLLPAGEYIQEYRKGHAVESRRFSLVGAAEIRVMMPPADADLGGNR